MTSIKKVSCEVLYEKMKKIFIRIYYKKKTIYKYHDPLSYFLIFILDYLLYLRYLIKNYKKLKELRKLESLRNSMKGKNAFVFANGPSLSLIDFKKVKYYQDILSYKVFCVNSFISKTTEILPDYYVLSDPAYFGYDNNLKEARLEEIKKDLYLLEKYKITLFVPLQFKDRINLNTQIYFFNDCELRWFNRNVVDITKPRSYLSMTAYKALAVACFMGFDKIYICGFDNNWFTTFKTDKFNRVYYINNHFINQGDDGICYCDENEGRHLGEILFNHSYLFSDLFNFPKNIINLDSNSLVDAFSKNHELDVYK